MSHCPTGDPPEQLSRSLPVEPHLILAPFISTLKMVTAHSSEKLYLPTRLYSATTRQSTTGTSMHPVRIFVRHKLELCRILGFCHTICISVNSTHVSGTLISSD